MTFEEWYGEDLTGQTYKGNLICFFESLTSLKGCPKVVKGHFSCSSNELTSLEHGPEIVEGNFDCYNNKLVSLKYGPKIVNGYYLFDMNEIISLNGLCYAKEIKSDFPETEVSEYLKKHYPEYFI